MASEAGPVEIVVDIVDNFSDELQELERKLDKLDSKTVSVDFEIDSEGEISKVKAQLKELKKQVNTNLDVDTSGVAKAHAEKASLATDMNSTLNIHTNRDGQFPGVPPPIGEGPMEAVRESSRGSIRRAMPDDVAPWFFPDDAHPMRPDFIDMDTPGGEFTRSMQQTISRSRAAARAGSDVMPMPSAVGDFFEGGMGAPQMQKFSPFPEGVDPLSGPRGLGRGFDVGSFGKHSRERLKRLGQTLNKLRPNIMMIWNALATLIPVMVTLAASAIGLAGAFGTLALAGGAILGLGLLGWGDSFSSSLQNLQQEARLLGGRLFDVLEPLSMIAQPIMQDWMEGAPRQVQRLVEPMENLMLAFEDPLGAAGAGIVGWVQDVVRAMVSMDEILTQIAFRFAEVAGGFIIDFMKNMVMFAYENQEAMIRTAGALRDLLGLLLDFSILIVRVLQPLAPLIGALSQLGWILSEPLTAGIIAAVGAMLIMQTAMATIIGHSAALSSSLIGTALSGISTYISGVYSAVAATWSWIQTLSALRGALVLTGIGAAAVATGALAYGAMDDQPGGTRPSTGRFGSPSGGGTTINIQGDVKRDEMNRLLDEVPGEVRNENRLSNEMER
jgi:hypothetical protein